MICFRYHTLVQEIITLQKVDHPNIVKIYEIFKDDSKLYIVMENVEGEELLDFIRDRYTVDEDTTVEVIKQLLKTIKYLNSLHICHRDLKPDNIMINPKTLQIKVVGK